MDTKIHFTHAYMLMLISWLFSIAHKLLMFMLAQKKKKKKNVNVICLPTEHQGVHKNSFRNVRAFRIELEFGNVGFCCDKSRFGDICPCDWHFCQFLE